MKEAKDKAIEIVEGGAMRRREMEKVITDLETRRDAVIGGLEQLSNQLAGAATLGKSRGDSPADARPPVTDARPPSREVTPPATNPKSPITDGNLRPPDTQPAAPPAGSQAPPSPPPPPLPSRQ